MASGSHSCRQCAAAIAEAQRYCLSCGARLGEPRLDPLAILAARRMAPRTAVEPRTAAPAQPAPRWVALAGMALLSAGAILGAALGPAPPGTLAAATSPIVLVTSPPAGPDHTADSAVVAGDAPPQADQPAPSAPPGDVAQAPLASGPPNGGAAGAPVPAAQPPSEPTPPSEPNPPRTPAPPKRPSVGHVFVVVLAGSSYEATFGSTAAPGYLRDELVARGQLLTHYSAIGRGALANRIALVSGQRPTPQTELDCPAYDGVAGEAGCVFGAQTKTLADQLATYGLEWRAYVDGMQEPCHRADRADPFVYFHSVIDLSDCSRSVLPLSHLRQDLGSAGRTPVFSYITPAVGAPAAGTDAFLRSWVPAILHSPAYRRDGLLVVTFDKPAADPVTSGARDERVGAVVLSRFVTTGTRNDTAYDHYALLRTIEDRIGVEPLGMAGDPRVHGFGRDVFKPALAPLQSTAAVAATERRRR